MRRAVCHRSAVTELLSCIRSTVDCLDLGVLLIDGRCRVLFANRSAESLLERHKGLTVENGDLKAAGPDESIVDRQLRAAIAPRPNRGRGARGQIIMPVPGDKSMIVLALPWRNRAGRPDAEPAAILFLGDLTSKPLADERGIARLYGLTRAEARLLRALLDGMTLGEHAAESGITLNTTKGYVKQLFGKTGTRRQADLLRLILADPVLRLVPTAVVSRQDESPTPLERVETE